VRRIIVISLLMALALVASACRRGWGDNAITTTATAQAGAATSLLVTTTIERSGASSDDPAGSNADPAAVTTSTTQVVAGMPTYQVADRIEEAAGDRLVVVVEPGAYTEVELQNLVFDIVDRFQPVAAVVVDDPAAVALVSADDLSDADREFLERHTFLTISDGIEVRFSGPYADVADLTIGS